MSEKFEALLLQIQKSKKVVKTSPKKILDQLGVSKRGVKVIEKVRHLAEKYDVVIHPEFATTGAYSKIELSPKPTISANFHSGEAEHFDLIPRLNVLKAANLLNLAENNTESGLYTITRDASVKEAISIMMMYDFSQLPVLSGKKDVDGLISWRAIGRALALGKQCEKVSDCMEEVHVLELEAPLFNSVRVILEKEVVLVKKRDKTICGILTATDIGQQFLTLSEPFLILEQIENHIRIVLHGKLTLEEIQRVIDIEKLDKPFNQISDLSFGQYIKIIENPSLFLKLKLNIDRVILVNKLEQVRMIRNAIMHFNPQRIQAKDLDTLRHTLNFFMILSQNI